VATQVKAAGADMVESVGIASKGLAATSQTLSDSIVEKMTVLADALLRNQQAVSSSATTAADTIAARVKTAGENVAQSMGDAAKGLVDTSDNLAQRITTILGGLGAIDAGLRSQTDSMRAVVVSLNSAKHALDETAGTWTRSSAPVVAAVEASKRTADELTRIVDRMAAAQRDMADMAKAVSEISGKASVVWDNYRGRFEKVDEDMQAAFEHLTEGARSFSREVTDFMVKLEGNLAKGSQALATGTEELREIAQMLGEAQMSKVA
jgi:uncharacterized phage infection (PIP) family protein YhgE